MLASGMVMLTSLSAVCSEYRLVIPDAIKASTGLLGY
jgi:hypothetical protein